MVFSGRLMSFFSTLLSVRDRIQDLDEDAL